MAGNIARRPNGKWRARYRDESGRERARHFELKRDANLWLDQVAASEINGSYIDLTAGRITFDDFFDQWSARQLWAPGTVAAMSLAARSAPFKGKSLSRIRPSDIETWIKSMDLQGLAPGTVKTRYVNVRSVFRAAVRDGAIVGDPTDGIRLPRRRRAEAAMSIPTPEQVGQILAAAGDSARTCIALCAFAGLRVGEAAAVQLGDVDFDRKSLSVSRQVQRSTGGTVNVRPPKYGSERVVFMADGLVDLVAGHVSDHGTVGDELWLFGEGSEPPDQNAVGYWWRKALLAAGVSGFKLHDLRHFYASGLIAAGCDVATVQSALGHARTSTTLDTYVHLWPRAANRTRIAAQSIINASLGDRSLPDSL